jgi:hypothetical protein
MRRSETHKFDFAIARDTRRLQPTGASVGYRTIAPSLFHLQIKYLSSISDTY